MQAEIKNPVLRFVVHGHVVLALGAAAQVWWTDDLLHMHADARLIGFVALAALAAYGTMRLLRMNVPELGGSATMIWYRTHARIMVALVSVSAIAAIALGWPLRGLIVHALWLPGLLAAFYILPMGITRGRPIGLRRIPFLKALIIAFVWASIAVVLPGTFELDGSPFISDDIWWIMSIWLSYFLAIAIAFDIRDLPYDLPSLHTIPQVFGARGAKFMAVLLLVPLLIMLAVMTAIAYYPFEPGWREPGIDLSLALPILGVLYTMVLVVLAGAQRPWWFYELLLDGSLILLPLLSWIGSLM